MSEMDDNGVFDAFKAAILQGLTSALIVLALAEALTVDENIMEPVVQFVATQVKNEVSEVAPPLVLSIPPSFPPSTESSSSSEND